MYGQSVKQQFLYVKIRPVIILYPRIGIPGNIRPNPSKSVKIRHMYVRARVRLCVCRHSYKQMYPYISVHLRTHGNHLAHAYDMQRCLPSIVRIGCNPRLLFLRLGSGCIQNCVMSQKCIVSTLSNPSTNSTFAVTPLALTPLVRSQVVYSI